MTDDTLPAVERGCLWLDTSTDPFTPRAYSGSVWMTRDEAIEAGDAELAIALGIGLVLEEIQRSHPNAG